MVTILMMSARMATPGLLKIKVFWNKDYDVINCVHEVTNKFLSRDSSYIVDVVMWPKFGNTSISMREVIITSILQEFDKKHCFSWRVVLVQVHKFGTVTRYRLENLHQCGKMVKTKSQKDLLANSYICRSSRRKTGDLLPPPLPPSWIGVII